MPALPPVGNVVRADLLWADQNDVTVYNRLFFSYSGSGPDSTDCHDMALALANAVGTHDGLWTNQSALTGCIITDLASVDGAQGEATVSFYGTDTTANLAGGTALVISYSIARRYRGGRPRNYFCWGSASTLSNRQAWNTDFLASAVSAVNAFIGAVTGETYGGMTISNHVNVSYYSGSRVVISPTTGRARNVSTLRDTPLVNPITAIAALGTPGSQRRRNRN